MSGPHRVVLSDFKAAKRDEGAIDILGEDGETYRIDPPELWPDDMAKYVESRDNVAMCRLLLGDRYDQFVEQAGGSATMVAAIIHEVHGVGVPESSASSSS